MIGMFSNCGSLTSLDLSHFVTSKVTDMSSMFSNCSSLKSLNINFDTQKAEKMQNMFKNCTSLTSLNISTFNTVNCQNFTDMFEKDEGLDLYFDFKTCSNLINEIPSYVKTHDTSENQ